MISTREQAVELFGRGSWLENVPLPFVIRGNVIVGKGPLAPPAQQPFVPVSEHRLREIAAGEYGPNRQEGKAIAAELLSARNAIGYHESHQVGQSLSQIETVDVVLNPDGRGQ